MRSAEVRRRRRRRGMVSPQRVGAHVCAKEGGREREGRREGGCIWRREEGGGREGGKGFGESLCLAGCFIGFNVCDKEGKVGFAVEKFEIGEEKRGLLVDI